MSARRPARRGVNVATLARKGGDTFRVQWRYLGKLQASPTFTRRGDAETLADLIADLGGAILATDPRVKSGSLIANGPDAPPLPEVPKPTPAARKLPTTLGYWLDRWIAEESSPRSRATYLDQARRLAPWRHLDISEWTHADSVQLVADLGATYKPSTTARAQDRLYSALRMAHRYGVLEVLPRRVNVKVKSPGISLTPGQVEALLGALPNDDVRELVLVMVETGLRFGEALGLQAGDLDHIGQTIKVQRSWVGPSSKRTGETKTANSEAEVLVPDDSWAVLVGRAEGKPDTHELWLRAHSPHVPERSYRDWYRDTVRELAARGELPPGVRLHDLRHTHGRWLLHKKWTVTAVADRLRNSPTEVMRTYGKTAPESHVAMAADISALMASGADELASKRRARMREGA